MPKATLKRESNPFAEHWEQWPTNNSQDAQLFLTFIVDQIRPNKRRPSAEANLHQLIFYLQKNTELRTKFHFAAVKCIEQVNFASFFTESGMPVGRDFWPEFNRRIRHKFFPPLTDKLAFNSFLNCIFYHSQDDKWVEEIGPLWADFFSSTGWQISHDQLTKILPATKEAALILSFQLTNLGFDKEIYPFLPRTEHPENPFLQQNYAVQQFYRLAEQDFSSKDLENSARYIHELLECAQQQLNTIKENHQTKGTSLTQNYFLLVMEVIIQRLHLLIDLSDGNDTFDTKRFSELWVKAIVNEKRKNSLRTFISQSVGYVAYQIAEVKGHKGKKYITTSSRTYKKMWLSAMAGGLIISFIALFKNILSGLTLAPMWKGFFFSVNYAAGFVAIEDTGSTLATKQPAFTASALAKSLDQGHQNTHHLAGMVNMIVDILRSQFASFSGNLLVVFPGSFILAWIYHQFSGQVLLSGDEALKTLSAQHPFFSLSIIYACFTGFFLFLSSIIAGYIHNKIRYSHWHERFYQSYFSQRFLPAAWAKKLRTYILNYGGAFTGNVALGFFLGMAGTIGLIFGLPFDIRHITIASGNVAIAIYGLPLKELEPIFLFSVISGVLLIGFFNFLISFALAFYVAIKSRGLSMDKLPQILILLWQEFLLRPKSFFWPNKS